MTGRYEGKRWLFCSFTGYIVRAKGLSKAVERRYEDFLSLGKALQSMFPACVLPQIPPIDAPIKAFEWFLRCLLSHPTVSSSQPVASFLLDACFAINEPPKPQFLCEMWSLDGSLMCDIEENDEHIEWMKEFFTQDRDAKAKLRECLAIFASYQAKTCGYLLICIQVVNYISNLHDTIPQNGDFSGLWGRFGGILELWRATGGHLQSLLQAYIPDLIEEQVKDYASIEKLMEKRGKLLEKHRKFKESERFRDLYGYFNYQSKAELEVVMRVHGEALSGAFGEVIGALKGIMSGLVDWDK